MSIWQTKKWGEMLVKSGQAEKIIELDGIFIEKRSIGLLEYGLFVLGLDKNKIGKDFVEKIKKICKKEKALFIQVELLDYYNLKSFKDFGSLTNIREEWNGCNKGYYKKFITPYTAIINLKLSEEEILTNMKPKGRYNIKLAEKKGIVVKKVDKTDENIKLFYDLVIETTSRDQFFGNTLDYYKTFLSFITESELLLAYSKDNKVIAGGIFIFSEDVSIYYYGASTSDREYRNLMAPYLLQWETIRIAKEKRSKIYDFLGVATPGEKNSSLEGVTSFKLKLTKDIVNVSDSYIWINKKIKYNILNIFRKLKSLIK